jgi:hypothetical protein
MGSLTVAIFFLKSALSYLTLGHEDTHFSNMQDPLMPTPRNQEPHPLGLGLRFEVQLLVTQVRSWGRRNTWGGTGTPQVLPRACSHAFGPVLSYSSLFTRKVSLQWNGPLSLLPPPTKVKNHFHCVLASSI